MSYRVLATRGEDKKHESTKIDAESVFGDHNVVVQDIGNANHSVLAASHMAVQKLPVSLCFEHLAYLIGQLRFSRFFVVKKPVFNNDISEQRPELRSFILSI